VLDLVSTTLHKQVGGEAGPSATLDDMHAERLLAVNALHQGHAIGGIEHLVLYRWMTSKCKTSVETGASS
jgi:hypothetical protein